MNDAGKRGVRGRGGHVKLERSGFIDGAGIDEAPLRFFHRHALAGNGGLIDH